MTKLLTLVFPIAAYLIEFFLKKNSQEGLNNERYIALLEKMAARGSLFAQRRREAIKQRAAVADLWKKEKEGRL